MQPVYTVGHAGKSLELFIRTLQKARIDAIVDIRLRNRSQLLGYAKGSDLAFLLEEGFGIHYEHRPELAPSPEALADYRAGGRWEDYECAFLDLLAERGAVLAGSDVLARYDRPCLLCSEPTADHCHRRLVAEWWASRIPGVAVVHL